MQIRNAENAHLFVMKTLIPLNNDIKDTNNSANTFYTFKLTPFNEGLDIMNIILQPGQNYNEMY